MTTTLGSNRQNSTYDTTSISSTFSEQKPIAQEKVISIYKNRLYDSCIIESEKLIKHLLQNLEYQNLPTAYKYLSRSYRKTHRYKKGLIAAKSSIYWAKKTNQFEVLSILLIEVGKNEYALQQYDNAIETYQEVIDHSEKFNDFESKSVAYNNIGNVYKALGKYTKAIQYYINDAELNSKLDRQKDLAIAYNNIGQIHLITKEYELAQSFFTRSKDIRVELNDEYGLALVSNNLGALYKDTYDFDSALDQFYIALATFDKFNIKSRVAEVYLNIADIFLSKKETKDAFTFGKKGLEINKEIENKYGINRAYRILGEAKLIDNENTAALKYFKKALLYFEKKKHYTPEKRNLYKLLVKVYQNNNNYKKGFEFQQKLYDLEVEFTDASNKKDLAFIHEKFNQRDQIQKIDKLQKEKELRDKAITYQTQLNLSFSVIIVVLSIFGIYIYFINKKVRKAHSRIRTQNREMTEIHAELTDSLKYASQIQQSLNAIPNEIDAFINDYFIVWQPSQEVSGDVYNVTVIDHKVIITMMDCAGHGVPAALLATLGIKTLNQVIQSGITSPDKILTNMDEIMKDIFDQSEDLAGIDMAVVTIDLKNYTLDFSGARRPLLYIENNNPIYIKGTKKSVCDKLSPFNYTYHKHRILLTSDIKFYLYSDGLPDQFGGEHDKKFKEKNLRALLIDNASKDFETQKRIIEEERNNWMNPNQSTQNKPTDDTLVMGFHINL